MSAPKKIAKVGIVYSDNGRQSGESKHLAHYLCGLLSTSGYAQIYMIPFSSEGPIADFAQRRITYLSPKTNKLIEVPASDVTYGYMNSITECHLIVVTVNSNDSTPCGQKLAEVLVNHHHVPIFSLQRGVRHGSILAEEVESKGSTAIEASLGFAVVIDPKTSAYVSTLKSPSVVFERLSKEDVKVADGPLRLLETMDLDISFRKVLTPFAWGTLVYENLYALNILTKGSLKDTLSRRDWRLIYALMIRENLNSLFVASKGGTWKPDLLLISSIISPKLLELMLIMPDFVFNLLIYLLDLSPNGQVISPGQFDLMEGRKTQTSLYLKEMVEVGKRYNSASPACELILKTIEAIESHLDTGIGGAGRLHSYSTTNYMAIIQSEMEQLYPIHDTVSELQFW
eukprot:CAMPEP_0173149196 /NCGR_PEP_ID=MMETSP1105-20130129/10183_1 /TAXON_ID=2985 /ORGANISM="Ochromonas sp., Strain BG-1" /LENGTH=398 /DNA_ID=CAMNT_0014064019 /DNA_START=36 /DNA_END=1229 /DNA_ORIENTATION=+